MAFATAPAVRVRTRALPIPRNAAACTRRGTHMLGRASGRRPPDFDAGWTPETDATYVEVSILSVATHAEEGGALVTLAPKGGHRAFKMAVTAAQADAVRAAARGVRAARVGGRPATHELFKRALHAAGALVTRAAITHVRANVFIARVWVRAGTTETHHDARPSDAVALALRAGAPLFLNSALLAEWGVPVAAVMLDAAAGRCEALAQDFQLPVLPPLSRSISEQRFAPEHVALTTLQSRLTLALRLERYEVAARLRDAIARICPVEKLKHALNIAVEEQRFDDAARIRDSIVLWRARLARWEHGGTDASLFGGAPDDIVDAALHADWTPELGLFVDKNEAHDEKGSPL